MGLTNKNGLETRLRNDSETKDTWKPKCHGLAMNLDTCLRWLIRSGDDAMLSVAASVTRMLVSESCGWWLGNGLGLVAESSWFGCGSAFFWLRNRYFFGCGSAEIWLRKRRNMVSESDFIPETSHPHWASATIQ